MTTFSYLFRALRKFSMSIENNFCSIISLIILNGNSVKFEKGLKSNGIPKVDVWKYGSMTIGTSFKMNNGKNHNMIGRQQPCYFIVRNGAKLLIGNNVGISATAIVCSDTITIGNDVKIGGNTVIYDTDFHSLEAESRLNIEKDQANTFSAPVHIGNNVFIGAHSTILKGVTIGDYSIIGAGSVISKSIPSKEIWAGNPAKFIRTI